MTLSRLCLLALLVFSPPFVWAVEPEKTRNIDPWEPVNRKIFEFNDTLDRWVLRPVAVGYRYVTPDFAEQGITNFIVNIYEFNSFFNSLLQGEFRGATHAGGRFLVNSTLGLLGLFDVATPMGITPFRADFGQTLAVWGLEPGPYLMVPFFGPRTVRSGIGTIVDVYGVPQSYIEQVRVRNSLYALSLVDSRARLLDAEELITGDRYIFVRDAYLQQRAFFVNEGVVEDDFSDFGADGWEEEF